MPSALQAPGARVRTPAAGPRSDCRFGAASSCCGPVNDMRVSGGLPTSRLDGAPTWNDPGNTPSRLPMTGPESRRGGGPGAVQDSGCATGRS